MYFSKDADSVLTFESPWIHWGWTLAHLFMNCSLGVSSYLEEISGLSHSTVFLYFFALSKFIIDHFDYEVHFMCSAIHSFIHSFNTQLLKYAKHVAVLGESIL